MCDLLPGASVSSKTMDCPGERPKSAKSIKNFLVEILRLDSYLDLLKAVYYNDIFLLWKKVIVC